MKTFYTVLLVSAISIAAAVAQPDQGDEGGLKGDKAKQGPKHEQISSKLDLTPEQQTALKELRQTHKGQMIDLRANVEKARLEVENQMSAETVNRDALMTAVEAEAAADLAVKKARIEHHLQVREIVGPEKAEQMRDMMKNRRGGEKRGQGGPGEHGGQRGPGGPGPNQDDGGW